MFKATLNEDQQTEVMATFWQMMMELESQADSSENRFYQHRVEGYFQQWNAVMGDNKEPAWVRRAARIVARA